MKNIKIFTVFVLCIVFLNLYSIKSVRPYYALSHAINSSNQLSYCADNRLAFVDRFFTPQEDGRKYKQWNFNRELVANSQAIFAAASYDTYEPIIYGKRPFRIADNHSDIANDEAYGKTHWKFVRRNSFMSGLSYDIYTQETADRYTLLAAFRGTDGLLSFDFFANASWFTQWFNPWDQYRQARNTFKNVFEAAVIQSRGKKLSVITTGHSLGGGLAEHVASIYPCTSAITFNSSFVSNTKLYGNHIPQLIQIYEKGDIFEMFMPLTKNTKQHSVYRFDVDNIKHDSVVTEHKMEQIAAGISRMAVDCLISNPHCEVSDQAAIPFVLFCQRYLGLRQIQPELCENYIKDRNNKMF